MQTSAIQGSIGSTAFLKPFLDSKGISLHNNPTSKKDRIKRERKAKSNRIRSHKNSSFKRRNLELAKQMREYVTTNHDLSDLQAKEMLIAEKNIRECAKFSLYREHLSNEAIEFIGAHTCDHRICQVCGNNSKDRVRHQMRQFLEKVTYFYRVQKKNVKRNNILYLTPSGLEKKKAKYPDFDDRYEVLGKEGFDIMHLALTVPHYKDSGFRGFVVYYDQLMKLFSNLRRSKVWKDFVMGGTNTVETTLSDNGLNIHIHALVFVRRTKQNRNKFHKGVLEAWNNLTFNPYCPRESFSNEVKKKILKSNKLIAQDKDFFDRLDPKGATMITLENLYYVEGKDKIRVDQTKMDKAMKGIMEALSYVYSPQCFNKSDGTYDLDLMAMVLPAIKNKRLRDKFGCLVGEESLNVKPPKKEEKMQEDFLAAGQNEVINPISLEPALREEYQFFIANAASVFHDKEREHFLKVREGNKYYTPVSDAMDTLDALDKLLAYALQKMYKEKPPKEMTVQVQTDAVTAMVARYKPEILYDDLKRRNELPHGYEPVSIAREPKHTLSSLKTG